MTGAVCEPVGIPFMCLDIPEGIYVASINISTSPHTPVFADLPKSEIQSLKEQINSLNIAMANLIGA